jgi:hypothetical protein
MTPRNVLSTARMALTTDGELIVNGAVVVPGASVEFVVRRALDTGRPVFIGFVADADARVHVLDKLDEAVADICVQMILDAASKKP